MVRQVGKGVFDFSSLRGDLNSEHVMPESVSPQGEFPNGGNYQGAGADVFVPSPIPAPIVPDVPNEGEQDKPATLPANNPSPSQDEASKKPAAGPSSKSSPVSK
ncbi:hypothetical protein Gekk315_00026 [Aeromonas phage Gekk3-15]